MGDIIEFRSSDDKKIRVRRDGRVIPFRREDKNKISLWKRVSPGYIADVIEESENRRDKIRRFVAGMYIFSLTATLAYGAGLLYMHNRDRPASSPEGIERKVEEAFCIDIKKGDDISYVVSRKMGAVKGDIVEEMLRKRGFKSIAADSGSICFNEEGLYTLNHNQSR